METALLDLKGIADLLQIGPNTVRRWYDEGVLPPPIEPRRRGRVPRWRRCAIEAWLNEAA